MRKLTYYFLGPSYAMCLSTSQAFLAEGGRRFFVIPCDLWACHWWLAVGALWLLWLGGRKDVWEVEEAQLERGPGKNVKKNPVLLSGRHICWMTNVWSSQIHKTSAPPGLGPLLACRCLGRARGPPERGAARTEGGGSLLFLSLGCTQPWGDRAGQLS